MSKASMAAKLESLSVSRFLKMKVDSDTRDRREVAKVKINEPLEMLFKMKCVMVDLEAPTVAEVAAQRRAGMARS